MEKYITLEKNSKEILYDDKVKKTRKGNGIIRLNNAELGEEVYAIFPRNRRNNGGKVEIEIDEILDKKVELESEDKYKIDFGKEYTGRKCIIIKKDDLINLQFKREDIIYDGDVKETYNGQGYIYLYDAFLGHRAYVIFPNQYRRDDEGVEIEVDKILNKGVRPNNDHTSRILLGKEYVGQKCFLVLQEE